MTSQATSHDQPARDEPPAQGQNEVAVLAALADPTRRQLLDVLVTVGRASATTLADRLPVSRQAVVKHLHVLETAGLVGGARAGREVLYVARPGPLESSARWLAALSAAWDSRLGCAAEETSDPGRLTQADQT